MVLYAVAKHASSSPRAGCLMQSVIAACAALHAWLPHSTTQNCTMSLTSVLAHAFRQSYYQK